jgi:dienelactone hydrolase
MLKKYVQKRSIYLTVALLSSIFFSKAVNGEVLTSKVNVPVVGYKCNERVREIDSISGELRVPVQKLSSIPVVVIMHSNAGIIGVGEYYAKALNTAGIATLEIDSFTPRGVRNGNDKSAPVLCDRLQDAWGALVFIGKDSRFNLSKVGIVGFSSGGAVAVMAGMGVRPARLPRDNNVLPREITYAAHFALYPGCANIMDDHQRIRSWINPGRPQNWGTTGKPIHIVSGTSDDFDFDPESDCLRMSKEFPEIANQLTVRLVEGATHAFDWPTPPSAGYSPFAKAQTGGIVTMRYSAREAAITQKEMVDYFLSQLK